MTTPAGNQSTARPAIADGGVPTGDALDALTARLGPAPGAARQARELVTEACARWELADLVGPACTVLTELVNNAVAHARTEMLVRLTLVDGGLLVEVADRSPAPPQARGPASPTTPGGRGLVVVQALAERWGCTADDGGKTVWALIRPE
ncbi:ATP-binding protein [Pilimelia columellifera]|uniref:Histidine kinase/HSP90-like ATPase domain-containing protein n=1 Tax=Pilimelia columellifera subsp. columellifera TaxID=706583 RepID=A0ABN3NAN4_9ACTN